MRELLGAPVAAAMKERLAGEVAELEARGVHPRLAIVRVGERPDDLSYERAATKRMAGLGIGRDVISLSADVSESDFEARLARASADPMVHGILVFRPLPRQLDAARAASVIDPEKDVDGMCLANQAKVFSGDVTGFAPCTAEAVTALLDHYDIDIRGRRAVVLGRSAVIGRPVAMLLLARDATVTVCHTKTVDLPSVCREAQILVAAVGHAGAVRRDMVAPGAVVVDVGINLAADGSLVGDVDPDVAAVAAALTPVPRGVGSVTTSVLVDHVLRAARTVSA